MNAQPHPNSPKPPLKIKKQIVAGFIIFRRTEDGLKFLLLYRRGNYWNFPKGHFEEGENSMATALREAEEETGLKKSELRIVPGFKTYVRFFFDRGEKRIFDTVILYLAETKQPEIRISPREHSGFAWFLYPDAQRVLGRYQGTKRALEQANNYLRGKRTVETHPRPAVPVRQSHSGGDGQGGKRPEGSNRRVIHHKPNATDLHDKGSRPAH